MEREAGRPGLPGQQVAPDQLVSFARAQQEASQGPAPRPRSPLVQSLDPRRRLGRAPLTPPK
eukprot:5632840-Alexandrium_andersonii.AAC.1